MERVVVTISSDLFDETDQEASLRKNLSVRALITEIQKEFGLPEGQYALRIRGNPKPLDLDRTIDQHGILMGAQLVFTRERRSMARPAAAPARGPSGSTQRVVSGPRRATLVHEETGRTFDIGMSPALIGRPDASNPATASTLVVNLADLPEARTVSRPHGSIIERDGVFLVESLAAHNLIRLNGEEIYLGERRSLRDGDSLMIGKIPLNVRIKDA